jgi:hypothetical protein
MNIYRIKVLSCNDFFVRAADEAEAVTKFTDWRDTPGNVDRPQDFEVVRTEVFLSTEVLHVTTPYVNYID